VLIRFPAEKKPLDMRKELETPASSLVGEDSGAMEPQCSAYEEVTAGLAEELSREAKSKVRKNGKACHWKLEEEDIEVMFCVVMALRV
jgi:hypothetical protein